MTMTTNNSFQQRILLACWGVGLSLTVLKPVLPVLESYSWFQVTFPIWGGTVLFIGWGLIHKAVRGG